MSTFPLLRSWPPLVMGIVNVTPDSFSDGGQYTSVEAATAHALGLAEQGADILDIGGESTRPGATPVSADVEAQRVLPVIESVRKQSDIPISVDTTRSMIARASVAAGANMWNDVSALTGDAESERTAADLGIPLVLMHKRGKPATMQDDPSYEDVVPEVSVYLSGRVEAAIAAGVRREHIWLDPGIGFGKRLQDNHTLMRALRQLAAQAEGRLLVGVSRKRFIEALDRSATDAFAGRLGGSLAAALHAARNGAGIVRVHDVYQTRQALLVSGWLEGESRL